ncbi:DUF5677 domain-containing protein [Mucilaginibacter sp. NFX135]|uniref:DUF5677 domain-containing protein n=1 Tax=Mucilaginibacter sp. NFX135 TaxID=3402687 RepID=UPI003AFADEB7
MDVAKSQLTKNVKVKNLIIENLDGIIENALVSARRELKIPEAEFRERMNLLNEEFYAHMYDSIAQMVADHAFGSSYLQDWRMMKRRSQAEIVGRHRRAFLYFFGYLHTCFLIYEKLRLGLQGAILDKRHTLHLCMYGNLCRMADEIGILLSHGYTSAALTLWRTFYEHTVVGLLLLRENSNELADRFDAAGHRDLEVRAESYIKRHGELGFDPLDQQEVMDIEQRGAWLREHFEAQLFKQDYGWAAKVLAEKPTFRAIEAHVGLSKFRPFYIWASSFTHPNFERLTDFWNGDKMIMDRITAQEHELQAFVDPMQLTMACFQEINTEMLAIFSPDHQFEANISILDKLYEKLIGQLGETPPNKS